MYLLAKFKTSLVCQQLCELELAVAEPWLAGLLAWLAQPSLFTWLTEPVRAQSVKNAGFCDSSCGSSITSERAIDVQFFSGKEVLPSHILALESHTTCTMGAESIFPPFSSTSTLLQPIG